MSNESTIKAEVNDMLARWKKIRDALAGTSAIKAGRRAYLPPPNATDDSEENAARYNAYIQRALWYDATNRTHEGLIGQIFCRDTEVNIPNNLVNAEDINGTRLTLDQQSRDAASLALAYGRAGLLADFPSTTAGESVADQLGNRPTINLYRPEQIINWRYGPNGLELVVLQEVHSVQQDQFIENDSTQYRVLSLVDGAYITEIYRDGEIVERYDMREGNGSAWDFIPFYFIGSRNNDAEIDPPPLEGLADLNIGHYRNSADYEESCFMVGQPTPWGAGLTQDWVNQVWKRKFWLGSRAFVPLPEGGACGLLQAAPNTMTMEAMLHKEKQMVSLGAKLVENRQTQQTATEVIASEQTSHSVLSHISQNVSAAYSLALRAAAIFANVNQADITFKLNDDFALGMMTPQDRQQLMSEWQAGSITFGEMRSELRKSGVATEEDEDAQDIIDSTLVGSGSVQGRNNG